MRMSLSDRDSILAGLLDFYSDRATTHASFVVAGTFGIYAVLFNADKLKCAPLIFILTYVALGVIGMYSFLNFAFYAILANRIKNRMEQDYWGKIKTTDLVEEKKLPLLTRRFRRGKERVFEKTLIMLCGWFLAVIFPFFCIVVVTFGWLWFFIAFTCLFIGVALLLV